MAPIKIVWNDHTVTPPVYVAATFTNWEAVEIHPRSAKDASGHEEFWYEKTFEVPPGTHQYKFRFGTGEWWVCDPAYPTTVSPIGSTNNVVTVPDEPSQPAGPISSHTATTIGDVKAPTTGSEPIAPAKDLFPTTAPEPTNPATPVETSEPSSAPKSVVPPKPVDTAGPVNAPEPATATETKRRYSVEGPEAEQIAPKSSVSTSNPLETIRPASQSGPPAVQDTQTTDDTSDSKPILSERSVEDSTGEKGDAVPTGKVAGTTNNTSDPEKKLEQPPKPEANGTVDSKPPTKPATGTPSSSLPSKEKITGKSQEPQKKVGCFTRFCCCFSSREIFLTALLVTIPIFAAYVIQK